ncbi:MAG: haloacid dehalogenase [Armatimonadetes bacterium CG_4_10_14_3_um_filter_66_18]|nr:haloacid dehalogenase [Armatimonadota bacterium]PIU93614.1 MAG: haloacid dehalogenase [Armatimonadetes bacterium CG06_land_8_20_14_3_00_66_21]PIX48061.1 MAG: haloacid dehalogenase [Armatimonadetes bacterium CG_4_8_14_3_um_filter_66_20]PIY49241.1 MAG: haloacid dehalogenase [Armatimonadetes bacterium CG_4_10_14_3_um_filter_66_18]PIZ40792.1 MAG: haloacid dehalogenase [Armatimonadetes bacterium CG_4_10_14_0_8_um_filter_66_14]PJB61338.1 MAG: haloacid dehalogenase [Armatimonadetes bacterium CG_4_
MITNIEDIAGQVRVYFNALDSGREKALVLSREITRASAETIRAIHRREYDAAEARLGETRQSVDAMQRVLDEYPDVWNTGFAIDSVKEHAEAVFTLALVRGDSLPLPSELGVPVPAYINGLAEAIGEGRRFILDAIRGGNSEDCERLLDELDAIYQLLVTLDYPHAITKGLRQRTDAARAILERTRGDLTTSLRQHALQQALTQLQARLGGNG